MKAGLLQACDDPRLLGFKLWPRQRDLLAAVEAGPRLHVWSVGRRSGKTFLGATIAVWDACLRPQLARRVRKGEQRYCVAVAVNLAQARLFVAAARALLEHSPLLAPLIDSATDDKIELKTGATIAAFPCTSRGGRGWPISTLLLDEFAHHVDGEGNSAAESVWRSLVPSTYQFGSDARVVVASTPYGAEGSFADLFERVARGEVEGVTQQFSSPEVNPTLDAAVLAKEFEADPDAYATEILARFVAGGGAYIDARRLAESVADRGELDRIDATRWVLGLDLGFAADPTGIALVGCDPRNPGRLRLGLARAWAPRRAPSFEERREIEDAVLEDVAEIARYFDAAVVCDQHFAPQVRDFLARRGVRVRILSLSAETKTLAFSELRARIYSGGIELYPHDDLLRELRGLRTQLRAGRAAVVTPRTARGHSDMAVSLALAVWQHDRHGIRRAGATVGASVGWPKLSLAAELGEWHSPYSDAPREVGEALYGRVSYETGF